jgi:hypothetical protein
VFGCDSRFLSNDAKYSTAQRNKVPNLVSLRTILGNGHAARGVASISLAFYDVGFCFAAAICCERSSYVDLLFKLATERTISCQAPLAACAISVLMQKMPRELYFVEPRDCKSVETLPSGDDSQYETKFDGYRAVAIKQHGQVKLYSRRGNSFTTIYP